MNKILLFTLSTFNYDARVKTYANYLKKNGFEVIVLSSKENDKEQTIQIDDFINYRIIKKYRGNSGLSYILYYTLFLIKAFYWVTRSFFKYRYNIIHYNNAPNFIIFSCIIPKIFGTKIILDNHDIFPLVLTSKFKSKTLEFFALLEQKFSFKFADRILCADHNQLDYLTSKKLNKNIVTILNVPSPLLFQIGEEKVKSDKVKLVYHGTISYRLGIDQILSALSIIKNKIPNIEFHLIGTGDYLEDIKLLNEKLNLKNIVKIYGKNIPVEELSKILNGMDIGIIGNRIFELSDYMLPVKLLEYVYLGLAVIAPRNKIIGTYFTEEMVCFYEPENVDDLAEKILFLYNNASDKEKFSLNASKFNRLHNYSTEMEIYNEVLFSLLKR